MGAGSSISPELAEEEALQMKLKGDSAFQMESVKEAIFWYTKALGEILPEFIEGHSTHGATGDEVLELRAVILCNRAASYLNCEQYVSALADARRTIDLKPQWYKGYYRGAAAAFHLGRLEEARPMIEKALAMVPKNKTLIELRASIFEEEKVSSDDQKLPARTSSSAEGAFITDPIQPGATTTKSPKYPRRKHLGAVYSWGQGDAGQLGQGSGIAKKDSPAVISKLEGHHVIEVAAGALHSVAISGTGETFSWGDNNHNQLGFPKDDFILRNNAVFEPRLVPKLIGLQAAAVTCGAGHTLVLMENGSVYGFGMNAQGQLGLGRDDDDSRVIVEPVRVPCFDETSKMCTAISTGIGHSCFLMNDGTIMGTGMNSFGQLGLGDRSARFAPEQVAFDFDKSDVKHISCGGGHTLVCTAQGNIFTCGSNSCGQLGTGTLTDSEIFQLVSLDDRSDAANVTAVAIASATSVVNVSIIPLKFAYVHAGEEFSAFISRTKHVYTCGLGISGSLGHGNFENLNVPAQIKSLSFIESLCASGQSEVFAVKSTGEVYCWGGRGGLEGLPGFSMGAEAGAHAINPDGNNAEGCGGNSATPMRVSILSKRKSIRQFVCGRKHNMVVVSGAYGPNCHVIKGLVASNEQEYATTGVDAAAEAKGRERNRLCRLLAGNEVDSPIQDGDTKDSAAVGAEMTGVEVHRPVLDLAFKPLTSVEAGKKISFLLQSRDVQNSLMETPGAVFLSSLTHLDSLDYELRLNRQGLELAHDVYIDDNLDGQYSGSCRLYLTGSYNLAITLDGLPISGSPFELNVYSGCLHPSRCFCWFGPFAVRSSAIAETKDGYGEALECFHGISLVFTVSARDKYGNKCDATDFSVLVRAEYVEPWLSDDELALDTRAHDEGVTNGGKEEKPISGKVTATQSFDGSSLGLFPCAVDTRSFHPKSRYLLHVAIDNFHGTQVVQGSPFALTVKGEREKEMEQESVPRREEDEKVEEKADEDAKTQAVALVASLKSVEKEREREEEEFVKDLTSQEKTQRRAEEAFKKFKAETKARRERERAAKKAKRTGGGFIIQYSKDSPF